MPWSNLWSSCIFVFLNCTLELWKHEKLSETLLDTNILAMKKWISKPQGPHNVKNWVHHKFTQNQCSFPYKYKVFYIIPNPFSISKMDFDGFRIECDFFIEWLEQDSLKSSTRMHMLHPETTKMLEKFTVNLRKNRSFIKRFEYIKVSPLVLIQV